jgi:hypothetical protein
MHAARDIFDDDETRCYDFPLVARKERLAFGKARTVSRRRVVFAA